MSGFIHGNSDFPCGGRNPQFVPVPFVASCEDCALEAWERMTTGGVNGRDVREHMPFVTAVFQSGHQHTEYLAYAAR